MPRALTPLGKSARVQMGDLDAAAGHRSVQTTTDGAAFSMLTVGIESTEPDRVRP